MKKRDKIRGKHAQSKTVGCMLLDGGVERRTATPCTTAAVAKQEKLTLIRSVDCHETVS